MISHRFDWAAEAQRAKTLIAAGEVDFELEEDILLELTGGAVEEGGNGTSGGALEGSSSRQLL